MDIDKEVRILSNVEGIFLSINAVLLCALLGFVIGYELMEILK